MGTNRKMIENNKVTLSGEIAHNFEFHHNVFGESFYVSQLNVRRLSGKKDIMPIMVSERLVDVRAEWAGKFVEISGQFRSYNKHEEKKNRLMLSIFAREIEIWEDDGTIRPNDKNFIYIDGYICKQPIYRETPLGREISDILFAVNRQYGKTDYIPTICWGRNARFASELEVGARLRIQGRIQSRKYQKKISNDETETRVAYEVSTSKMEVMEDGQK